MLRLLLCGSLAVSTMAKVCDFSTYGSGTHCLCSNSGACAYGRKRNGVCEDGGPGSTSSDCELGTDCSDCGKRQKPYPPEAPPPHPSPPRPPPPPPKPPPPAEFPIWTLAFIPVVLIVFLVVYLFTCGPLSTKQLAKRAERIRQQHIRRHKAWQVAGIGERYQSSVAPNFVPPVESSAVPVVQAVAVPPSSSSSPNLWQSVEAGGLGCELLPPLIEAGVTHLADLCCAGGLETGAGVTGGAPRFCTFDELRTRFPSVPRGAAAKLPNVHMRQAEHQNRVRSNGLVSVPFRPRYERMIGELVARGVAPTLAAACTATAATTTTTTSSTTTITTMMYGGQPQMAVPVEA